MPVSEGTHVSFQEALHLAADAAGKAVLFGILAALTGWMTLCMRK